MAIPVNFNGKRVIEPGVYSQIKSGVPAKDPVVTFGNLFIIDTGSGVGYGSGSGIMGSDASGVEAVYAFENSSDFKAFMRGGIYYDLADLIFKPTRSSADLGPSTVYFARASETTPATISIPTPQGTVSLETKNEGLSANGRTLGLNDEFLVNGFGAVVRDYVATTGAAVTDSFIVDFYEGSYTGKENVETFNGLTELESKPKFIISSVPFKTSSELVAWMESNPKFNSLFKFKDFTAQVDIVMASEVDVLIPAIGATETYTPAAFDKILESSKDIDNEFFLTDKFGVDAVSIENEKLLDLIKEPTENQKFLIVGGGTSEIDLETSVAAAEHYDSPFVILVHGGVKRINVFSKKEEIVSSLYNAANFAGRLGGLAPQEPITFKKLKFESYAHNLSENERIYALQRGVVHLRKVTDMGHVINQGVNTLQKNTQLFNPDGSSFEISIMRIASAINKQLVRKLRPLFIGGNRGRVTPEDVKLSVQNYLRSICVKDQEDNLIINFDFVTVTLQEDYYDVQYGFYPNGPINKMFLSGFMLDSKITV